MEALPAIQLQKGASAVVSVDLTGFDMQGGKVVLTMKDAGGYVVGTWDFDRAEIYEVVIPDELTACLSTAPNSYSYDFMWHIDGERFAQCAPSAVVVSPSVGGWPVGSDD